MSQVPRKSGGSLKKNIKSGGSRRTTGGTRSLPSKRSIGTVKPGRLGRRSS